MNEKEILQKIKEDADHVIPPASLQPDAIEQMLKKQAGQDRQRQTKEPVSFPQSESNRPEAAGTSHAKNNPKRSPHTEKRKRQRRIMQLGSLAAVFALAILAFSQADRTLKQQEQADVTVLQSESKTAEATAAQAEAENAAGAMTTSDTAESPESKETAESTAGKAKTASAPQPTEAFTYVASYEELYRSLKEQFGQNSPYRKSYSLQHSAASGNASVEMAEAEEDGAAMDTGIAEEIAVDTAVDMAADVDMNATVSDASIPSEADSLDFSGTNLQESGVDEADIVKTDGKYLYILRQDASLAIVSADLQAPALSSVTELEHGSDLTIHEMYLDGDLLNIIVSCYTTSLQSDEDVYYTNYNRETTLLTYDITDRTHPVLTGTVTQDGFYEDSRKNGPYIYLFTCYQPTVAETYAESAVIPKINGTLVPANDIYLPESLRDSSYLVISSVDTAAPNAALDTKILVSGASNYYVSAENIYVANEHYSQYTTVTTELIKFHYAEGGITGVAAGTVKGYLNNSFSMNEYNGMLRVVSTYQGDELSGLRELVSDVTDVYYEDNWAEHNALYVLDESLQVVGSIDGLAEGETIRSARFFGNIGYFVTFRQTDPLFSVDLSDPANPKVLGELKISGFSSYLHFYGENLLLGIGYEADEETGVTSGLKLSMFDISDPADVREADRLVIPGVTWCPAIEDYKSILVSPEKNLIGFFCDDRYMAFSYDAENGFTRELLYDFFADSLADQAEYNNLRGLYIEDAFYLAGDRFVITFDMENGFEKTAVLPLPAAAEEPESETD